MHALPMLGGLGPVIQTEAIVVEPGDKQVHLRLVPPGANRLEDIWKEEPLSEWSGLAWIACLLSHLGGLGCIWL